MGNEALSSVSTPGLQDRLELGVAHEDFDFDAVEDRAGVLIETIPNAKLTMEQARVVVAHLEGILKAERVREESGMLLRALNELVNSANLKMDLYAMALVAGISDGLGYGSQEDVAQLLKVSRSNVSKCVRRWAAILQIQTLKFRRNEENRKHCSEVQTRNHWRNRSIDDLAG